MMTLLGLRFAYIEETAEDAGLRLERLKAITGGSPIAGHYMGANWVTFEPTHTLVIATNHRPIVNTSEHAAWRRLKLIPFPYRYGTAPEDRPLDDHIRVVYGKAGLTPGFGAGRFSGRLKSAVTPCPSTSSHKRPEPARSQEQRIWCQPSAASLSAGTDQRRTLSRAQTRRRGVAGRRRVHDLQFERVVCGLAQRDECGRPSHNGATHPHARDRAPATSVPCRPPRSGLRRATAPEFHGSAARIIVVEARVHHTTFAACHGHSATKPPGASG